MSNRRRISREDARRTLARSLTEEPVFVGILGDYEMWARGPVMLGVPVIREGYPAEMKTALDRRRRAMLTGRCECGARMRISPPGRSHGMATEIEHEAGCIAHDDSLDDIAARHGYRPVRLPADAFDPGDGAT